MANEAKRALQQAKQRVVAKIKKKRNRKTTLQEKKDELSVEIDLLILERDDIQNVIDTFLGGE